MISNIQGSDRSYKRPCDRNARIYFGRGSYRHACGRPRWQGIHGAKTSLEDTHRPTVYIINIYVDSLCSLYVVPEEGLDRRFAGAKVHCCKHSLRRNVSLRSATGTSHLNLSLKIGTAGRT